MIEIIGYIFLLYFEIYIFWAVKDFTANWWRRGTRWFILGAWSTIFYVFLYTRGAIFNKWNGFTSGIWYINGSIAFSDTINGETSQYKSLSKSKITLYNTITLFNARAKFSPLTKLHQAIGEFSEASAVFYPLFYIVWILIYRFTLFIIFSFISF